MEQTAEKRKQVVELVMNDIVLFYQRYFNIPSLDKAVIRLNTGQCYTVAHLAGQVLQKVYGMEPKFYSHCLHAWLEVDGVAYDTLFPQGYTESVVSSWRLDVLKWNQSIMEIDDYGGGGFVPNSYAHHGFYKAFLRRWGLPDTEIVEDSQKLVWFHVRSESVRKRMKRWYKRKSRKMSRVPLFLKDRHLNVGVLPYTHTHY